MGVLTISSLRRTYRRAVRLGAHEAGAPGDQGLVIDVRNPGGLLESAVDVLSRFVEDKIVVRMRFRSGQEEVARTSAGSRHNFDYPVAVLMDEDSASAGCLQDLRRLPGRLRPRDSRR